ncbi:hypothetical protein KGF54_000417 [Candida jiufengensis]|uniref:uncharacterized protein n=1 Tax=Candida jiufengensis TaxID=497108 RepID=UPI0022249E6A|nr:uncharacterized protein KGF54_000417 [Candida jiufengensis]KAI5956800.1 hypothetical protein KGF54_000417 [Candida jiufengensis]
MNSDNDEDNIKPALPIDGVDADVSNYLNSVRSEAKSLSIMYQDIVKIQDEEVEMIPEDDELLNEWSNGLYEKFISLKEKIKNYQIETSSYDKQYNLKWKESFKQPPPDIDYFIYALNRKICFDILVFLTDWITLSTTATTSQWIWKIFLKLDNFIEANECSILRDLANKAILRKQQLLEIGKSANSTSKFTYDMIITIVGKYYGQTDLLSSL